ncbi:BNR/Asp-box repeat protein [compost metagenome]
MGKTLYKTEDEGKSWSFVNDVSQSIEGYVTGVSFSNDKIGWIAATHHGEVLVPLYRTKDGGKSWNVQQITIPNGYKYGNAYAPTFDSNDAKQGTLKIEFVNDTDKKVVEFKTTDGGETWKS